MSTQNISVWLIIPQTNLHVGNESVVSFSVIDKAIQRDATTQIPCINSSSLKGAIKEYLTNCKAPNIKEIFGSVKSDDINDTRKGNAVFFDANLLFIPEQCTDAASPYQLIYNEKVMSQFCKKVKTLGGECTKESILARLKEEKEPVSEESKDESFKELQKDENLPIIARNCLDNGESVNLWYEQVLPSHSVLGTIIQTEEKFDLDGKIVQIGANATIGYGYCKFIKL